MCSTARFSARGALVVRSLFSCSTWTDSRALTTTLATWWEARRSALWPISSGSIAARLIRLRATAAMNLPSCCRKLEISRPGRLQHASVSGWPTSKKGHSSWSVWGSLSIPITVQRSEEHTSELQSRLHLVCRLLLEKKKKTRQHTVAEH